MPPRGGNGQAPWSRLCKNPPVMNGLINRRLAVATFIIGVLAVGVGLSGPRQLGRTWCSVVGIPSTPTVGVGADSCCHCSGDADSRPRSRHRPQLRPRSQRRSTATSCLKSRNPSLMANCRSAWSVSRSARLRWARPGFSRSASSYAITAFGSPEMRLAGFISTPFVVMGTVEPQRGRPMVDVREATVGGFLLPGCRADRPRRLAPASGRPACSRSAPSKSGRSTSRTARCGSSARRGRRPGCHLGPGGRATKHAPTPGAGSWCRTPPARRRSGRSASGGGWVISWASRRIARISTPGATSCPTWRTVRPTSPDPS